MNPALTMGDVTPLLDTDLSEAHAAIAVRERPMSERYASGLTLMTQIFGEAALGRPSALNALRRLVGGESINEALSAAEFPTLFGDVVQRMTLGRFSEWGPTYAPLVKRGTFRDLTRTKRTTQMRGGNQPLGKVGEFGPYPQRGTQPFEWTWQGYKYGADFPISWETILADDLNQLTDLPAILASSARAAEALLATQQFFDANGPHASLFTVGYGNLGTAPLSIEAVEEGFSALGRMVDPVSGNPLFNRPRYLVVWTPLEITARKIVESPSVTYAATAAAATPLSVVNIASKLGLEVVVLPFIGNVVTSGTVAETCWLLVCEPNAGPLGPGLAAVEMDTLLGLSGPLLLQRRAEWMAAGGGDDPRGPLDSRDSKSFRVVYPLGAGQLLPYAAYGSTGQGA